MIFLILLVAVIGYFSIIFESPIKINKTISSILTGSLCWMIYAFFSIGNQDEVAENLLSHFGEIAGLLVFLLGAMTIVELIDLHKGFSIITHRIRTKSVLKLLWIVGLITFILSAMLDNLATAIIMITLLKKLMPKGNVRMILAGIVIIAANSGGAFSPIGDITTTLLWIGGQVSASGIATVLFIPALVSIIVPLIFASFSLRGFAVLRVQLSMAEAIKEEKMKGSLSVLIAGVLALIMVPVIKSVTGLPPFIGILFGLAFVSLVSIVYHRNKPQEEKEQFSIASALTKVDVSSIFYFMGILLLVFVLQDVKILENLSLFLREILPNTNYMVVAIGFLSSLIDNGSLVAATQGMFSLQDFPMDNQLWEFIALCAGTGGSMLIIGSASGIAVMEKEKITFMWYLKHITPLAIVGYLSGISCFALIKWLGY